MIKKASLIVTTFALSFGVSVSSFADEGINSSSNYVKFKGTNISYIKLDQSGDASVLWGSDADSGPCGGGNILYFSLNNDTSGAKQDWYKNFINMRNNSQGNLILDYTCSGSRATLQNFTIQNFN
ncbi:hypothetical protein M9194_14010 [Vibrio sp. S4M6]|uniref:hypothetical protein n=1 Tax=Vibrio sinus TaxID=2946865 RepID=UPI00202A83B1|nr:hypothetical protein [Vibrio sinus]MCL9782546.1 hypothetical protein [Vibrio sinus]